MTYSDSSQRVDYLDAARAFALILGVFFHASLSFVPVYIGWAVMDVSTGWQAAIFATISHSFRLELFFLIAGFFSHMTFHRGGSNTFFRSRLVRIALPLLVGWFILRPLIVSGFVMGGQSLQGDVDISGSLITGLNSLQELPAGFLVGTHLWFLYYLLLITLITLSARFILLSQKRVGVKLTAIGDRLITWLCQSPLSWALIVAPVSVCLWFMDGWGMDTPDKTLVPHLPVLMVYGGFFILGWLLHRQSSAMDKIALVSWPIVVVAVIAAVAAVVLMKYQMQHAHPYYQAFKIGFVICYAVMMWLLVIITLGIVRRVVKGPNKVVRYLADASYWMYLIHLPIVIFLQVTVAEWPLHWALKWCGITTVTVIVSLLIYDVLVRNTVVGATLSGRRKIQWLRT